MPVQAVDVLWRGPCEFRGRGRGWRGGARPDLRDGPQGLTPADGVVWRVGPIGTRQGTSDPGAGVRTYAEDMRDAETGRFAQSPVVAVLDVVFKVVLLASLALVLLDPAWGNLEGKAPTARALIYPLLAFAVPLWWAARRPGTPYPWLPDLLLTMTGFSDILGNRLDLYDQVVRFDDAMHFATSACVTAALVLLTLHRTVSAVAVLERSVALGMTAALLWEVFEYFSFVTRSSEMPTAYADTVGDLVLGWLGALTAALLVHFVWRHHLPEHRLDASAQATWRRASLTR